MNKTPVHETETLVHYKIIIYCQILRDSYSHTTGLRNKFSYSDSKSRGYPSFTVVFCGLTLLSF